MRGASSGWALRKCYGHVKEYNRWQEKFEAVSWFPAAQMLADLRMIKEPEELESMTVAQRIAEKALTEALESSSTG